jgi:LmbE family N-acetylglucosaminyl deacetylase
MTLLGVDGWDVLFPDTAHMLLDTIPTKDVVGAIERSGQLSLNALRPSLVLMPSRTFNQDHEALFRACLAATRPHPAATSRFVVPHVLVYDNGSAHWSDGADWFQPTVYVDISDVLDLKVQALGLYRSQVVPQDPESDGCIALAKAYGSRIGRPAAEAFQPLRLSL